MRPDVKLGVAISFVLVVVAGGYYLYRDSSEVPIPVSGKTGDLASLEGAPSKTAVAEKSPPRNASKGANSTRRKAQAKQTKPISGGKTNNQLADSGQSQQNRARPGNQKGRRPANQGRKAGRGNSAGNGRIQNAANGQPATPDRVASGDPARGKTTRKPAESRKSAVRDSTPTNAAKRAGPAKNGDRGSQTPKHAQSQRRRGSPPGTQAGPNRSGASKNTNATSAIAVETHRLQPGDTLAGLAMSYYGSERHVRLLLAANPQITNPDRLKVGAVVKIPPVPRGDRSAPSAAGTVQRNSAALAGDKRTYTVQSGDSFYAIAESQLGEASRWNELFELNKTLVKGDPKRLQIGQVIALPD